MVTVAGSRAGTNDGLISCTLYETLWAHSECVHVSQQDSQLQSMLHDGTASKPIAANVSGTR